MAEVSARVGALFDDWGIGPGSLLICGGARGGDLIAASAAHARGATVWVLLAHDAERFVETSVAGGAAHWVDDFWRLVARSPSWTLDVDDGIRSTDNVYAHANAWMLEVAEIQAAADGFRVVAIWDGKSAEGAGGAGDLVVQARRLGAEISVVDPLG